MSKPKLPIDPLLDHPGSTREVHARGEEPLGGVTLEELDRMMAESNLKRIQKVDYPVSKVRSINRKGMFDPVSDENLKPFLHPEPHITLQQLYTFMTKAYAKAKAKAKAKAEAEAKALAQAEAESTACCGLWHERKSPESYYKQPQIHEPYEKPSTFEMDKSKIKPEHKHTWLELAQSRYRRGFKTPGKGGTRRRKHKKITCRSHRSRSHRSRHCRSRCSRRHR